MSIYYPVRCKFGSYIHVGRLGISNKYIAVPRQDRVNAVLSGHCNIYIHTYIHTYVHSALIPLTNGTEE